MDTCDVLIIGGGPAGSTCAWKLRSAGLDVLLMDRAQFPRHKPCAGWITPAVLDALEVDPVEYSEEHVLQEIRGFRTGLMYGRDRLISYGRTVSYGIRRYEFDHYLLQRSGARLMPGVPVRSLEQREEGWVVNGNIRARMIVGAGGHFCPVARFLGARVGNEDAVVAQVAELPLSPEESEESSLLPDTPALFFCRDMKGYGWALRKGDHLNVGLGRIDSRGLPRRMADFRAYLGRMGIVPADVQADFQGHAYLIYEKEGRRRTGDDVILIGDAAGLSYPQSGEGILPAVESALMAAEAILEADGDYRRESLEPYVEKLAQRFGNPAADASSAVPSAVRRFLGARLLSSRFFTRNVVLDRWFLHPHQQPLNF
ncbi:NAD(P)/FAD-dependent oxidoreductase [Geobacter sp. DSM 9736]|uniref:NAD(P)/FAD-dependent oxidoreductase n=1 Tax=Geobacter sp. DSM 9736 TaxID=1277350 RepID=UPI000B511ECF|nr:NAD(P)/FAD-dependent oxidoreductase [Geobacter sp. DSM 9736]SNB45215.1 geranylgeranyl reductase family [Geobacter sp. DSM 9736]